jgi:hypothetical protein
MLDPVTATLDPHGASGGLVVWYATADKKRRRQAGGGSMGQQWAYCIFY